jgi:hypothetical protein
MNRKNFKYKRGASSNKLNRTKFSILAQRRNNI